jgi:hypothetical protein
MLTRMRLQLRGAGASTGDVLASDRRQMRAAAGLPAPRVPAGE